MSPSLLRRVLMRPEGRTLVEYMDAVARFDQGLGAGPRYACANDCDGFVAAALRVGGAHGNSKSVSTRSIRANAKSREYDFSELKAGSIEDLRDTTQVYAQGLAFCSNRLNCCSGMVLLRDRSQK
jgi:hypothetical protein